MMTSLRFLFAITLTACLSGSWASPAPVHDLPDLPAPIELDDGVLLHKVSLLQDQVFTRVWIYMPAEIPADKKLPCVLVAPAGTRLWHGMDLGEGDRPEHLPFVKADCVVVAYSLSGAVADDPSDEQFDEAVDLFLNSDGGLANAKAALDYALEKVPAIDKDRIFTSGHSSAATVSLQVAQSDDRIKGCIAFAPISDLKGSLEGIANHLEKEYDQPRLKNWAAEHSPLDQVAELTCPVFLLHAEDDSNVPIAETRAFEAALVKSGNKSVTMVVEETGNHYQSMIAGLPKAIEWLKAQ